MGKLVLFAIFLLLTACSSISYYGQSIVGHSKLMLARKPLDKAIAQAEKENNSELLQQLSLARDLRRYASDKLGLPDNRSYASYAKLDGEYPVWTVVAAEEFSVEAKKWCYPVIGCASYRGYFSPAAANEYAIGLQEQGLETTVGGAVAYSTLGWFADPLLPSMMRYGVADLAETLFHELAHQQLYVKGDSSFNEAFATVVGEQGAIRWLGEHKTELLNQYRLSLKYRIEFGELLDAYKQQLTTLYQSSVSKPQMRLEKQRLFAQLRSDYAKLKQGSWQGYSGFDGWFEQPLNNARLAAFATYRELTPQILALFEGCNEDFGRFYNSLDELKSPVTEIPATCQP